MARLLRSFYAHDARKVARELLGRILVTQIGGERTSGRIVETEAYLGSDDLASHAYRGPTQRNRAMFLGGGHAYVYFIYGMYYCFNVVTGEPGTGEAVLIRALEPLEGIETMRGRRGEKIRRDTDLASGPGKLTIALGIGPQLDGADLTNDARIWIEPGEALDDAEVMTTPRIGITKAVEHPWRWVRR
jgi:DNA-3-methyladenine glycosylase